MFLDYVKLAMTIRSELDCHLFQKDIDDVSFWGNNDSSLLNIAKCTILSCTRIRKQTVHTYKTRDTHISQARSIKDLGTWFATKLAFQEHIKIKLIFSVLSWENNLDSAKMISHLSFD